MPAVSFDLGNEWDDFEDEKLLRASEGFGADPQRLQNAELRDSGRAGGLSVSFSCYCR